MQFYLAKRYTALSDMIYFRIERSMYFYALNGRKLMVMKSNVHSINEYVPINLIKIFKLRYILSNKKRIL